MLISELGPVLGAECVQGEYEDGPVASGYSSDLLSDVMANAVSGSALVTVQAHKNAVAVASLVGIAAIVICNGRAVPADMAQAAKAEGIAVFRTAASAFEASGRLWVALGRAGSAAASRQGSASAGA